MSRNWENLFSSWSAPPGKTEQGKSDNAERAVRNAISSSEDLKSRSISIFPQGSYRNRTTVRQDSDVDICVMCTESFFFDLPEGHSPSDFGISTPASYSYPKFKNEVHAALINHFGSSSVSRGNKAFDIHENTYRVDADVVATFEYRRYRKNGTYRNGTSFPPDNGSRIINWPDQNYENGVNKNSSTGRRFKAIVRILKHLRNEMEEKGIHEESPIPSYLIECLVWNVPNDGFGHSTYTADVRYSLAHLCNNTRKDEDCSEWGEINELKYLFRSSQPWDRLSTNRFLNAAWNYIGFE
jgi:hypothetical protein